jgi:hypothetical protein
MRRQNKSRLCFSSFFPASDYLNSRALCTHYKKTRMHQPAGSENQLSRKQGKLCQFCSRVFAAMIDSNIWKIGFIGISLPVNKKEGRTSPGSIAVPSIPDAGTGFIPLPVGSQLR